MFSFFSGKNKHIETITELQRRISELEEKYVSIMATLMGSKDTSNKCTSAPIKPKETKEDVSASSFSFDFNNCDAFSIERLDVDGKIQTVIGFWVESEHGKFVDQSWFFECSPETHERLVQEFNVYKEKKHAPKNMPSV